MKAALRIVAATAIFAGVHSALASRKSKRIAAKFLGDRNRNGLYRVFYIVQSVGSFALLTAYIRRQPGTVIYNIGIPASMPMRAIQLGSLLVATHAAQSVGLARISGAKSLGQWLGTGRVEREPEAQGPALRDGRMVVAGPFQLSRHPLNFWPLFVLWLNPKMTTNLAAFNVAATAYLVAGSVHEECRLREAYGEPYELYESADVPFYIPALPVRSISNGQKEDCQKEVEHDGN